MMPNSKSTLSVGARMAILIFVVEILVLAVFAIVVYRTVSLAVLQSFDRALLANAEALATLVEFEDDDEHDGEHYDEYDDEDGEESYRLEGFEMEFAPEVMLGFTRRIEPDAFAVIVGEDDVLAMSEWMGKIPADVWDAREAVVYFDLEFEAGAYRGAVLSTIRLSEDNPMEGGAIRVFFASSARELYQQLSFIRWSIGFFSALCVILTAFAARVISAIGLRPLTKLAGDVNLIGEERLDARLATEALPSDLLPIADSVNELLTRLEAAFAKERRFSADAAHELRTPIATLKSGVQAAQLKANGNPERAELLSGLLAEIERLEGLCDALLLLTEGTAEVATSMSTSDWLLEVEAAFSAVAANPTFSGAVLDTSIPDVFSESTERVRADAATAFMIAKNLLENAAQHGGVGVSVRLSAERSKDGLRLIVADTGAGVSPEDAAHLFERFYRADSSRARTAGGYGLGLAICQTLAQSFGGRIDYEPNAPTGCRFTWHVRTAAE